MTRPRRGLTLLETLIASAMLAMLASAVIPLLSACLHGMTPPAETADQQRLRFDLGRLADAFMKDPGAAAEFGQKDLAKEIQAGEIAINWPKDFSDGRHPVVSISAIQQANHQLDHLWLEFRCDGQSVIRYLMLPKPKEANTP